MDVFPCGASPRRRARRRFPCVHPGDRTVQLPLDAKRSPGALKYLFTELLCAKCGGPEVMTAPSLPETRLLCSSKELFQLIRCAEEARSFPPPLTSHDPHSASPEARGG